MSFLTNNLIYNPISGIMLLWYKAFTWIGQQIPGVENPESNGIVWALSVIFLVVTLRALLYWPMARQMRFSRKMQALQPKMKELQKRYKNDREKLAVEMRKLQKKEGFNPLLGCLPALIQVPVFLGLFHVLRSFNRMGTAFNGLGMSAEETRNTGNYLFSATDVQNFLDARLFGAPLSAFVSQPVEQFQAFVEPGQPIDFTRTIIIVVAIPLMIASALMTHLNAKQSFSRQPLPEAGNMQANLMRQMMLYIFPIGILATGAFWPIAILVYMMTNNIWTFGQQHLIFRQMDNEDIRAREAAQEKRSALAPKVGVKPVNPKRGPKQSASASLMTASSAESTTDAEIRPDSAQQGATNASPAKTSRPTTPSKAATAASSSAGAPRPGQKPNTNRKKKKRKK